jgi:argininosuccinate lyase
MKGLPLAYNRDMQEDKEPLFDTCDTVSQSLQVFTEMLKGITIHKDAMRRAAEDAFITATDLADYLVRKGMPFRQAHEVVGRAVLRASGLQCGLGDMPLAEYKQLSPLIREDVYDALTLEASVSRRTSHGGTSPDNLKKRLDTLKKRR